MSFYSVINNRGPGLYEVLQQARASRAQKDQLEYNRKRQEQQDKQQAEHQKQQLEFQNAEALARRQEAQAKQAAEAEAEKQKAIAHKTTYWARMAEAQPQNAERIFAAAAADGVTIPKTTVSIPGGWADNEEPVHGVMPPQAERIEALPTGDLATEQAPEIAMEMRGDAAGVLGAPEIEASYRELATAADAAERATKAGGKDPVGDMRKEFNALPVVKDTQVLASAYEKIRGAPPTGPGDMSLIYGIMKMNDPGSTVREGEYATAENAGGVTSRIRTLYNKIIDGQRLDDKLRGQYKSEASRIFGSQLKLYEATADEYRRLAGDDAGDVVLERGFARPSEAAKPAAKTPPAERQAALARMNARAKQLVDAGISEEEAKRVAIQEFRQGVK